MSETCKTCGSDDPTVFLGGCNSEIEFDTFHDPQPEECPGCESNERDYRGVAKGLGGLQCNHEWHQPEAGRGERWVVSEGDSLMPTLREEVERRMLDKIAGRTADDAWLPCKDAVSVAVELIHQYQIHGFNAGREAGCTAHCVVHHAVNHDLALQLEQRKKWGHVGGCGCCRPKDGFHTTTTANETRDGNLVGHRCPYHDPRCAPKPEGID